MASYLICWVGLTDLKGPKGQLKPNELGPIGQAASEREFDYIVLLVDHSNEEASGYASWLAQFTKAEIEPVVTSLSSPTDFGDIYKADVDVIAAILEQDSVAKLTFHLSPGTPAMAAIWIILSKTRFPAELIETSRQAGLKVTSIPFDISAEFIPDLFRRSDEHLERLTAGLPVDAPEFDEILHKSVVMQKVIARARRVAPRSIPVLIEGESGTGKELFSRAIHQSSPRKSEVFIPVNCGAIPRELVESLLFGHKKGAFTGASTDSEGYFESANGGTLFLDEVGELPLDIQVRLLRVIQEKEIVPLGDSSPRKIDVRIIAATNRSLAEQVESGHFREDLYYRLAVAVVRLPPLKEREGDLSMLADKLMQKINEESETEPGYQHKVISVKAKKLILEHGWPGNVRELQNTLRSAAIWSEGGEISEEDLKDSLLVRLKSDSEKKPIMEKDISHGIDLKEIIAEMARRYLTAALAETNNNKTKAADLLGLGNYQTLSNWMERYGLNK
jgi:transcriptional regulator with PAS, ATPase and Fis domain